MPLDDYVKIITIIGFIGAVAGLIFKLGVRYSRLQHAKHLQSVRTATSDISSPSYPPKQLRELKESLKAVTNDVNAVQKDIVDVKVKVAVLEERLKTVTKSIEDVQSGIDSLRDILNGIYGKQITKGTYGRSSEEGSI